ncbi:DUF2569 family protein [Mesorhizobium sp. ASY16-5R]|uniref:DUF2569 family protein n=1 Tax=Mesorhizobium sp. ASY16-5R TaxID=3445772 RepID=UPI003FA0818D
MNHNRTSEARPAVAPDWTEDGPVGVRGWLFVLLLYLAIWPIAGFIDLLDDWNIIVSVLQSEPSYWLNLIVVAHVLIFLIFLPIFLLYLAIKRWSIFRVALIVFLILRVISALSGVFVREMIWAIPGSISYVFLLIDMNSELVWSVFSAVIWLPYAIFSKRIRNTFISEKQLKAKLTRTFA